MEFCISSLLLISISSVVVNTVALCATVLSISNSLEEPSVTHCFLQVIVFLVL